MIIALIMSIDSINEFYPLISKEVSKSIINFGKNSWAKIASGIISIQITKTSLIGTISLLELFQLTTVLNKSYITTKTRLSCSFALWAYS